MYILGQILDAVLKEESQEFVKLLQIYIAISAASGLFGALQVRVHGANCSVGLFS